MSKSFGCPKCDGLKVYSTAIIGRTVYYNTVGEEIDYDEETIENNGDDLCYECDNLFSDAEWAANDESEE